MITENFIAGETSGQGSQTLQAINPATQSPLPGDFVGATAAELDQAAAQAHAAWQLYKHTPGGQKAAFLRAIATEIEGLGDTLVQRVMQESGLPEGRVVGERGRTCGQLRLFADLVEEGSWVDPIIDVGWPDAAPPKPDIRNMLQAVGPVAVFGASNFPLAFSTAGGDTASALAAGCPVIVKAHPSHLGSNALVAGAIDRAAKACQLPPGVFSSVQGAGYALGTALVQHPCIKAVGFTGSLRGGMALVKAASERKEPIPVFAEMGSNNPIFILPEHLKSAAAATAQQIAGSVNLGAGQFCTNPGLLVLAEAEHSAPFLQALEEAFAKLQAATMLNEGIANSYQKHRAACLAKKSVTPGYVHPDSSAWEGQPAFGTVSATDFLADPALQEEIFGPFTLVIRCQSSNEMLAVAHGLQGQLTATVMGQADELPEYRALYNILAEKAGRLIFNGVPTGVAVNHSMQHGGPFPAASDSRFTSVGTGAIRRFVRPVAYQNCPDVLLPPELQAANPLGLWRTVDGKRVQE